jgi:hypothetical protein
MHAHAAKIVSETRLHKRTRRGVERLAGRAQYVMHDWWHMLDRARIHCGTLRCPLTLLAARLALATRDGVVAAGARALEHVRLRWRNGWR